MITKIFIILLLFSGTAWAKEDCSKLNNFKLVDGRGPEQFMVHPGRQDCRIANALEDIAEALKKSQ